MRSRSDTVFAAGGGAAAAFGCAALSAAEPETAPTAAPDAAPVTAPAAAPWAMFPPKIAALTAPATAPPTAPYLAPSPAWRPDSDPGAHADTQKTNAIVGGTARVNLAYAFIGRTLRLTARADHGTKVRYRQPRRSRIGYRRPSVEGRSQWK